MLKNQNGFHYKYDYKPPAANYYKIPSVFSYLPDNIPKTKNTTPVETLIVSLKTIQVPFYFLKG